MKLRGIEFGPVLGASGAQGWFGEGYPYHKWVPNLSFDGCTFVAKTTTLHARRGNMPLKEDLSPSERFPKCIVVKPFKGVVLNAVGLTGPGAASLLDKGTWQQRREPFFLSFMSVDKNADKRHQELCEFVSLLKDALPEFHAPVGLQWNLSCPNAGLDPSALVDAASEGLDVLSKLGIPILVKVNALFPVSAAVSLQRHGTMDGICMTNSIPYGKMASRIDWRGIFGRRLVGAHKGKLVPSPLAEFGGGGLSGAPLFRLVENWVRDAREAGFTKAINAGGGVLHKSHVDGLFDHGADSVFVGSVAILRGWRVPGIIRRAHELWGN